MRPSRLLGAAGIALAAIGGAAPAQARLGPVLSSYGNWELRRSNDLMTDRAECAATYRGDPGVQLFRAALYVKTSSRRSPRAYRYRIDDDPPSQMMTASELVWRTRAITFTGADFNRIVRRRRLRIQVISLHHLKEFDLDLSGIYNAYGAVYYCR